MNEGLDHHKLEADVIGEEEEECLRIVLGLFTIAGETDRREGWRRIIKKDSYGLIAPTKPKASLQCGFN